jgi:hypothetical protein
MSGFDRLVEADVDCLRECRGAPDIANVNGTLTCEAQPGAGQTPWA